VIDINLIGTFNYVCQGALAMSNAPENEDGERGVILCCSSQASTAGQIGQAAYSASKGGVDAIVLPIARELARIGVRVNAISPGLVSTNIGSVDHEDRPKTKRDHLPEPPDVPRAKHYIFPRRQGHSSEFASLALEVIRNTMINGEVIRLDGAMRFPAKW
jgi:NAD(P)-dependent dehydrogenase (short-subunit alcohol dehydrogenase family)